MHYKPCPMLREPCLARPLPLTRDPGQCRPHPVRSSPKAPIATPATSSQLLTDQVIPLRPPIPPDTLPKRHTQHPEPHRRVRPAKAHPPNPKTSRTSTAPVLSGPQGCIEGRPAKVQRCNSKLPSVTYNLSTTPPVCPSPPRGNHMPCRRYRQSEHGRTSGC